MRVDLLRGPVFLSIIFLCWGSFLNMLAYRLIHGNFLALRSFCPSCKHTIAWFDVVPLFSYVALGGRCRVCRQPISWLYPFIEALTAILFVLLFWRIDERFIFGFGIFFSALIVTIRTDLETMLISRYVTLFLVPFGWFLSFFGMIPVTLSEAVVGALSAGIFLFVVARIFAFITHKEGMGQGDIDLLMFIGSFLGFSGWWMSLLIGSLIGSLVGVGMLILRIPCWSLKIPFGPLLAIGAIVDVFLHTQIMAFLLVS